jgi:hypothetical protein
MSNVVKFQKTNNAFSSSGLSIAKIKEAMPNGSAIKTVLSWMWLVVRLPVFLILYWLRLPIVLLCNLISIPMMFAWLFAWYAFPEKTAMVWGFAVISLLCFVISWTYDFILMALSPQEIMKTL